MDAKPNIIFIITHDVGPVYGAYGNAQIRTPHIDALAQDSIRFDSHYCQWPLCGPSRANIFTGCRPLTTGRFNNQPFFAGFRDRAPGGFASLPEYFAKAGYASRGVGWVYHDNVDRPSWPEGHVLPEENKGKLPEWAEGWMDADYLFEWKAPESRDLIRRRLQALKDTRVTPEEFRDEAVMRGARGPAVENADVGDDEYYDGKAAALACAFLEDDRLRSGRPYFLGVGFVAPHTPFRAPGRYWDLYDRDKLILHPSREWPRGSREWMAGDSEPAQYYTTEGYSKPWKADESQLRELLHGHYATISYIDALIGRILDAAKAAGDWENTIVVFTSDHGFSEGAHGYWGKHNMWDSSLHVPLFIKPAGGKAPGVRSVRRVTEHVDIYPTLCALAGRPAPNFCEGRNLLPLMRGVEAEWKDAALSHRKHMWHDRLQVYDLCNSLRTPRYRYTEYLDQAREIIGTELFDYEADPLESVNLAGDSRYAGLQSELQARLRLAVKTSGRSL